MTQQRVHDQPISISTFCSCISRFAQAGATSHTVAVKISIQLRSRTLKKLAITLSLSVLMWTLPREPRAESLSTPSSWLLINESTDYFGADNNAVTANFGGAAIETERTQPGLGKALIRGDRFSLNFSESSGRDLRDGRRILTSRQLNQGANWRHEVGFGFTPLSSENLTLSVTGGLYDARRPANVRQQKLRLGETEAWRKHRGMDVGLDLKLFGDRLHYEAGYAWSDYIRTDKFSGGVRRPDRRAIADPGWQSGDAQRHRVEANILNGKPVALSAYGLYQTGGPSFRKPPRSGMSLPLAIGEIRELGASLDLNSLSFNFKQQDRSVGGRERERIEGKIAYSPVTFSLFQQENARVQDGRVQWREDTIGGAVKFDLEKHRHQGEEDSGFSIRQLLPSMLTLGMERSQTQYGEDSDDPKGVGTGVSLGLYWAWNQADTGIAIYRKSRVIGSSEAHETDYGLDLSHTVYSNNWDVSAYLSVGSFAHTETDNNFRDLWAAGGVSASYYPEHFPDVRLSVDFNRYDGVYPDFAERFGDQDLTIDLAVDLSKYLAGNDFAPSLQLHYYAFPNQTWASSAGRSGSIEHAIGVTLAARF